MLSHVGPWLFKYDEGFRKVGVLVSTFPNYLFICMFFQHVKEKNNVISCQKSMKCPLLDVEHVTKNFFSTMERFQKLEGEEISMAVDQRFQVHYYVLLPNHSKQPKEKTSLGECWSIQCLFFGHHGNSVF